MSKKEYQKSIQNQVVMEQVAKGLGMVAIPMADGTYQIE